MWNAKVLEDDATGTGFRDGNEGGPWKVSETRMRIFKNEMLSDWEPIHSNKLG